MATVQTSTALTKSVVAAIERLRVTERNAETPPPAPVIDLDLPEWAAVRKALWAPLDGTAWEGHHALVIESPRDARFLVTDAVPGDPLATPLQMQLKCRALPRHRLVTAESYYCSMPDIRTTRSAHPYFEAMSNYTAQVREIDARWGDISSKVQGFLSECRSLNQALKLWPDLARYVPQSYLDRVATKAGRAPADDQAVKAALAKMDLDAIAASTVSARFAAASS